MKNNKLTKGTYKPIDFDPKAYAESERANNPEFAAAYNNLSETPITQADIGSGKLKLVKRNASGAIIKAPETTLVKMTANMHAGDLTIDADFENMPPAGREQI